MESSQLSFPVTFTAVIFDSFSGDINTEHSKTGLFIWFCIKNFGFQMAFKYGTSSEIKMNTGLEFKWHSISKPFAIHTTFDNLKLGCTSGIHISSIFRVCVSVFLFLGSFLNFLKGRNLVFVDLRTFALVEGKKMKCVVILQ